MHENDNIISWSRLKPGPARPRKIRLLQPNYWPGPAGLWTAAKGQKPKIRPIPTRPGARPCGIRGLPLKWWPSPMLPVYMARCYFTWKLTYSCMTYIIHEISIRLCGILARIWNLYGLMAVSRRPPSSAATAVLVVRCPYPSSSSVIIHHRHPTSSFLSSTVLVICRPRGPLSLSVVVIRHHRHLFLSSSSSAVVVIHRRHPTIK